METKQCTLVKAVAWSLLGLAMVGLVGLLIAGSIAVGVTISVISTIIGLACYFAYECAWARVRWGRPHG